MEKFNFEIKDNNLTIGEDVFDLNEILIGEIIKLKDHNSEYSIKLTFKDDFVNKWIILEDYYTNNKAEIIYHFNNLATAINKNNPKFTLYNYKYFLNLENIDEINIQKNLLSKSTIIKSGNFKYVLSYNKNEYNSLQDHFSNLNNQNKGI